MIKINQADLDALNNKLGGLKNYTRWATPLMYETVYIIQRDIAVAPRKASGAFTRTATPGQKRAFWAKVRSGEARFQEGIGYVRTGNIPRGWTARVSNLTNGVQGKVGNNQPGAIYVHGRQNQQVFHALSGWRREDKVIEYNTPKINRVWERGVARELSR